jgi:hypothetical protein
MLMSVCDLRTVKRQLCAGADGETFSSSQAAWNQQKSNAFSCPLCVVETILKKGP